MPDVRVTIDGKEATVPARSTILDAAKAAGVNIPVLCDHPALDSIGACRMCLVEVEKQRVLQPACTFPVTEGMVVHTDTPAVKEARRFVLQLLFSERNHFCMYCQMSGSCELQSLAYDYGLDHWEYDRAFPQLPVDASRKYFVMDHNRCILCRRCVRACDELVGNGTLGLKNRGARTMVIADADVPFGESSCVLCGTCLQVCPTGALMDRASAYMGADKEITRVESRCIACSIGCGVEAIVRENRVIRIEGDWDSEPSKGLLCDIGRFVPLHDKRQRVRKPLVKAVTGLEESSWEEALNKVGSRFRAVGDKLSTVVTGFATTETAQAISEGLPGEKSLMGSVPSKGPCDSMACLNEADLFIVVKADLTVDYQVAGFFVKRGVTHRGARLILVDGAEKGLAPWAFMTKSVAQIDEVKAIAKDAQAPVILYDAQGAGVAEALLKDLPKAKGYAFPQGGNARGIAGAGIDKTFSPNGASAYYVVAGEAGRIDPALMKALKTADFVAVQASYREPWDQVADVILPSPTTYEKGGTMINAMGMLGQVVAAVVTKLPSEVEVVERVSESIH